MYTLSSMKKEKLIIHGKFESIMRLSQQMEKAPKKFGTDELLSHSGIHLIEIIGDNEGLSVTDISKHLEITKGAVSQSLKRLETKGFTTKETDPENLSRSNVMLTSKGYTAYWAHKHWHETMDGGFAQYMDELGEKEYEIIVHFLEKVEDFLNRRINSNE
ncbi:MAG: MarR family transcriptional regulator [Desulfobacula sp.]|nr:MarR family transcriptional regulator [Desulfobacula sp.]